MKKFFSLVSKLLPIFTICLSAVFFTGCGNKNLIDKSVSESRSEIYYCEQDGFTLTAFYSKKEYPYCADGITGALSDLFEIRLKAPDNSLEYNVCFTLSGKEISGETSFESVRQIYTFSISAPCPTEKQIDFKIISKENEITLTAKSVKTDKTLTVSDVLQVIQKSESDRINALKQDGIFAGEIYVRLVYKDGDLFYYAAIFDRAGNSYSMLIDAETGEILATKEN